MSNEAKKILASDISQTTSTEIKVRENKCNSNAQSYCMNSLMNENIRKTCLV